MDESTDGDEAMILMMDWAHDGLAEAAESGNVAAVEAFRRALAYLSSISAVLALMAGLGDLLPA